MEPSTATQLVFVDDADPDIAYQGNWVALRSESTELASLEYPQRPRTPWYGTVHTQSGTGGFSYTFDGGINPGTAFSAFFLTFDANTVTACTIDGVQQHVEAGVQGVECRNNATLSADRHNLSVSLNAFDEQVDVFPNEVTFDGLFYTPSRFPDSGVDVAFQSTLLPERRRDIGNSFEFGFNGLSIGIYCLLGFSSSNLTSLSYFVDDGPPINFTISKPTNSPSVAALDFQLIIQTPRLSPGSHIIHVAGLNDHPSVINILPRQFIVQNITSSKSTELNPVPAISTTTTPGTPNMSILASSPTPTNKVSPQQSSTRANFKTSSDVSVATTSSSSSTPSTTSSMSPDRKPHISIDTIVGISTAGFVILVVVVFIFLCWRRASRKKRHEREDGQRSMVLPFSAPHASQVGRFRLPQYVPQEKTEKYRQVLGVHASHSTTRQGQETSVTQEQSMGEPVQPLQGVRYRLHEDGGRIETSDEQIVDLPPIYGTFGNQEV